MREREIFEKFIAPPVTSQGGGGGDNARGTAKQFKTTSLSKKLVYGYVSEDLNNITRYLVYLK